MPQPIQQPQTQNPKLTQFLDKLNKLAERYQYRLKPTITLTQDGIIPKLSVIDVPPKAKPKKGRKK